MIMSLPTAVLTVAAPIPPVNAADLDLWDFAMKGGVMMVPIALCSFIAVTVVIERLVFLRRRRITTPDFVGRIRAQARTSPADAIAVCRQSVVPVAPLLRTAIAHRDDAVETLDRRLGDVMQHLAITLRRRLRVLSVIAAVSPLLGLLGTILGMITAFRTVAASAEALGKTELLAEGIYEAMITTAAGLVVAIPCLIAYHWLAAKVDQRLVEVDLIVHDFTEDDAEPARTRTTTSAPDALPADLGAALTT